MGDRILSRYVTNELGLASLPGRLIEYQLRLRQGRECRNGVIPYGTWIPVAVVRLVANWYTPFIFTFTFYNTGLISVLWRCWLGARKGIRPVKTEWWGVGVGICLKPGADLHMAQLTPLPLNVSHFSEIQIGFTFLVPAHPGGPGQRAIKWVFVCVCVLYNRG